MDKHEWLLLVSDDKKDAWREELERRGLENVKLMVAGVGRGALVRGSEQSTEIPRDFVEDWVFAEEQKASKERRRTMVWAIVGSVAGIIAVLTGLHAIFK